MQKSGLHEGGQAGQTTKSCFWWRLELGGMNVFNVYTVSYVFAKSRLLSLISMSIGFLYAFHTLA